MKITIDIHKLTADTLNLSPDAQAAYLRLLLLQCHGMINEAEQCRGINLSTLFTDAAAYAAAYQQLRPLLSGTDQCVSINWLTQCIQRSVATSNLQRQRAAARWQKTHATASEKFSLSLYIKDKIIDRDIQEGVQGEKKKGKTAAASKKSRGIIKPPVATNPPTLTEVTQYWRQYCLWESTGPRPGWTPQICDTLAADWYSVMQSRDWTTGKQILPIRDWQAAARTGVSRCEQWGKLQKHTPAPTTTRPGGNHKSFDPTPVAV